MADEDKLIMRVPLESGVCEGWLSVADAAASPREITRERRVLVELCSNVERGRDTADDGFVGVDKSTSLDVDGVELLDEEGRTEERGGIGLFCESEYFSDTTSESCIILPVGFFSIACFWMMWFGC